MAVLKGFRDVVVGSIYCWKCPKLVAGDAQGLQLYRIQILNDYKGI